ncbi:hypothetical protein GCM10027168_44160 [Streptomyces capparidis]
MEVNAQQLEWLALAQDKAADGWATDDSGIPLRSVEKMERLGLCRTADPALLATLRPGSPPAQWAAQLTEDGRDLLVFHATRPERDAQPRPAASWLAKQADPHYREIALRRTEMTVLRRYLDLAPRLSRPPVPGLRVAAEEAAWDAARNRWLLQLTAEEIASLTRGLYLERLTGAAMAYNWFAREYQIGYTPDPASL